MAIATDRKLESQIYAGLWLTGVILVVLDIVRARSYTDLPVFDVETGVRLLLAVIPFAALFAVNNCLLIPRLLKQGRYDTYFIKAALTVLAVWVWQALQFYGIQLFTGNPEHQEPPQGVPQPLMPLPLFLDVIYDILIGGINLAVSLMFQHFDDRLEQERLKKENAENQLTYLKAQINPHFYMNMLNNIHGMIEIDTSKAQDMLIDMSGLMRYTLYESSRKKIELSAEVKFVRTYIDLMRLRYPENAVSISTQLPTAKDSAGIYIAPLLFIVFIENAFKHGVSYNAASFISINITLDGKHLCFSCLNSKHTSGTSGKHEGIGLENVRQRMDIIYGNGYRLDINDSENLYSVNLTLPYETENACN